MQSILVDSYRYLVYILRYSPWRLHGTWSVLVTFKGRLPSEEAIYKMVKSSSLVNDRLSFPVISLKVFHRRHSSLDTGNH